LTRTVRTGRLLTSSNGTLTREAAADADDVRLIAEVAEKVNQAADARAAVGVGARGDAEEAVVGVRRLLVALEARGDLPEVKLIVGLARIHEGGPPHSVEAGLEAILVEINQCQAGHGHRLVALEA
jgi:hypothetical protein